MSLKKELMKAVVNTGPGKVELKEIVIPEPGPGRVRIKTAFCGVCATDLVMIKGWERTGYPSIPGHEWSGVVDAAGGGVESGLVGKACVAENVLSDGGEVGFEHAGGYGEYFITEAANVRLLPEAFPLDEAALIEPLAVCVRGLKRLGLEDKSSALVIGDGPIGLIFVSLLKAHGVREITCSGGRRARLELACSLGADETINYHDAENGGRDELRKKSYPVVIEASGAISGMRAALDYAAKCGKILVLGDYAGEHADFAWSMLLHNELQIIGSNASARAWDEAVGLAVSSLVPLGRLISAVVPANDFKKALDMAGHSRDAVKVVLKWM
jgi:2-desacetyl-2-hydroxyethyl bacteriochlorophyllide A dehydrogenase